MPVIQETELRLERRFDPRPCRHFLNGDVYVLHCHHYATLYSQLADDCGMLDGRKLLAEVAEDTFFDELGNYYDKHGVTDTADRIALAEQYYAVTGLGQMHVRCAGPAGAEVELSHSHVDEGWIKKWGQRDKPVNFITQGYIAGALAAIFGRPRRSYVVVETESLVKGDERSRFQAVSM